MIRRYAPATILLFSLLLTNGNCQDVSDKNFKTECFTEIEESRESDVAVCEDSRINIKGTFYRCESALLLRSPIKRIGFMHDDLLVLAGRQNFHIDANISNVRAVRRIAPLITQLIDKSGNTFYGGNNVVYVKRQIDNEYIEIITHDVAESHNDIALDEANNYLFILSRYEDENTSTMKNSLYAISTTSIDASNESIKAEILTQLKDVTSLAYNPSDNFLYFGIQKPNGDGKLIKIKGQTSDPCALNEGVKQDLLKAVGDFKDKLIEVFDKSTTNIQSRVVNDNDSDRVLALTWENEELARQLNSTMIQLESLKRRFFNPARYGPSNINSPSFENFEGDIQERSGSSTPPSQKSEGYHVNILISAPQVVPLNGSLIPNAILFSPISISVGPEGVVNSNVQKENSPVEVTTMNPILIPNLYVRQLSPQEVANQSTTTTTEPTSVASRNSSPMDLKSVTDSDYDYNLEDEESEM